MQQTYVMVKPHFANYDFVIEEIKNRLKSIGANIVEESFIKYSSEEAKQHYIEHLEKSFYPELEKYITSDKAYGMVITGTDIISKVRSLAGGTMKIDFSTGKTISLPEIGTIRRDIPALLSEKCRMTENVLHSSDSEESAKREIKIFQSILKKQTSENYK